MNFWNEPDKLPYTKTEDQALLQSPKHGKDDLNSLVTISNYTVREEICTEPIITGLNQSGEALVYINRA